MPNPREQWLAALESPTLDEKAINTTFSDLKSRFLIYHKEIGGFEAVADARDNLNELADNIQALSASIRNLGPGAMRILTSGPAQTVVAENLPRGKEWMLYHNQPEGSLKPIQDKFDPDDLPDHEIGKDAPNTKWMNELELLWDAARKGADRVCGYVSKGNINLAEKMNWKRPKDWLAQECLSFLAEHNITESIESKATTMMRAILDATKSERNDSRENDLQAGGAHVARNAVKKALNLVR